MAFNPGGSSHSRDVISSLGQNPSPLIGVQGSCYRSVRQQRTRICCTRSPQPASRQCSEERDLRVRGGDRDSHQRKPRLEPEPPCAVDLLLLSGQQRPLVHRLAFVSTPCTAGATAGIPPHRTGASRLAASRNRCRLQSATADAVCPAAVTSSPVSESARDRDAVRNICCRPELGQPTARQ